MPKSDYDFSGWATRANIRCGDGRTIMPDAFKSNDGQTVPLVWNHRHDDHYSVLGHALLESRPEGVYAYGKFNDTESGQTARMLVDNGDITSMSIYANQLKEQGSNVFHGCIREVSLVLAGANPGAKIENIIRHDGMIDDEAANICFYEELILHSDDNNDEEPEETEHSKKKGTETMEENKDKTIGDIIKTMNEEQKTAMYYLIDQALKRKDEEENEEGGEEVKHNIFDDTHNYEENYISHDAMTAVIKDSKRYGSMRESALEHGITNIDYLFPDAQTMENAPMFIARPMAWVTAVMGAVHHTPYARVRSVLADITADEARAKGFVKGKQKVDEVFSLLKRETTPQTIYKKQKLHRDDIVDITDFDIVAWLKTEMRMMLDEELARAFLIGDGRSNASDDKINPLHIRPIWLDDDLFTIKADVDPGTGTANEIAKSFIRTAIKARKDYRGSGNPVLFTYEDILTDMLLLEDQDGRVIYDSEEKLRLALRVSMIVTVPVMDSVDNVRTDTNGVDHKILGIIVNMQDYNVGADKGGAVNMFDDFDIDYNAQKYLIETRCSGALVKPYSAIAIELPLVDDDA